MGLLLEDERIWGITSTKSCLVAFGYQPKEGIDFSDSFAPTPNAASIRLLSAPAGKEGLSISHDDAEQACIRSDRDTGIYSRLPPACKPLSRKVFLLKNTIQDSQQVSQNGVYCYLGS